MGSKKNILLLLLILSYIFTGNINVALVGVLIIFGIWGIRFYPILAEIAGLSAITSVASLYYWFNINLLPRNIYIIFSFFIPLSIIWLLYRVTDEGLIGERQKLISTFEIMSLATLFLILLIPGLFNLINFQDDLSNILQTFLLGEILFNTGIIIMLVSVGRSITWTSIRKFEFNSIDFFTNSFLVGFLINRIGSLLPWVYVVFKFAQEYDFLRREVLFFVFVEILTTVLVTIYYIGNYHKKSMRYKTPKKEDALRLHQLEKKSWYDGSEASIEMYKSRIDVFPKGIIYAEKNNEIKGVVVFQRIVSKDMYNTWYEYTDGGYIKATHDPNGEVIFGINLAVDPDSRNKKIATKLMRRVLKYTIKHNIKEVILGSRMPFYHTKSDTMSPEEYVSYKDDSGRIYDPEIRLYLRQGFKIDKIVKDYFYDPESLDYGVIVRFDNPLYTKNSLIKYINKTILCYIIPLFS